jgi:hypothetical protein
VLPEGCIVQQWQNDVMPCNAKKLPRGCFVKEEIVVLP